jgi:hypothetical protein
MVGFPSFDHALRAAARLLVAVCTKASCAHRLALLVCKMSSYSVFNAEYIALSTAAQEAVALRRLFTAFNMALDTPTVLYEDNAGAISISEYQGAQPERSKHIDVRYHYIRELIHTSQIKVVKIDTTQNKADMFTKALSKAKHGTFTHSIMGYTSEQ